MSARHPSDSVSPAPLGQPLTFPFSNRTTPTRFLKGALSERLASWSPTHPHLRGVPSPSLINAYHRWGETGSIGIILTGNILVEYDHLEGPGNLVITMEEEVREGEERFERFREGEGGGEFGFGAGWSSGEAGPGWDTAESDFGERCSA